MKSYLPTQFGIEDISQSVAQELIPITVTNIASRAVNDSAQDVAAKIVGAAASANPARVYILRIPALDAVEV